MAVVSGVAVVIYARLYATLSVLTLVLLTISALAAVISSWLPMRERARGITCVVLAIVFGFVATIAAA